MVRHPRTLAVFLITCTIISGCGTDRTGYHSTNPNGDGGTAVKEKPQKDYQKTPGEVHIEKPVVYYYPEEDNQQCTISLEYDGEITTVFPAFTDSENKEWSLTAMKDGTLNVDGRNLNYLFWEGSTDSFQPDFTYSYCIKGEDTENFLWEQLHKRGLTDTESGDFLTYWLPKMEHNRYNVITFIDDGYRKKAVYVAKPKPAKQIRVFMAFKRSEYELPPITDLPDIVTPGRGPDTLVEWGGMEVTD